MRKTFKLTLFGGESGFYYEQTAFDKQDFSGFSICAKFVRFCGVTSTDITASISTKRPGKKGWQIVRAFDNPPGSDPSQYYHIGKDKVTFDSLYCHRELFAQYNTNIGWIKVDSR